MPLTLRVAGVAELDIWGTDDASCMAVHNERMMPRYFVASRDIDCDGFINASDCNSAMYCDAASTDPVAQTACVVETCEPCLTGNWSACTLGTHSVCRDTIGGASTRSCDGSAACGDAACLPGSACVSCVNEPQVTDCLSGTWPSSVTTVVSCPMPTCDDGSIVEVSLPHTDCSDARMLLADDHGLTWTTSVSPACVLRLELRGPAVLRVVTVAFDVNAAASASIRLSLEPHVGTCGSVGTCGEVPARATCDPS